MTESTNTPATSGGATSEAAETAETAGTSVLTLTPDQLDQLAAKLAELLPAYLIYRDPPVVPVWEVPAPPPAPGAVEYAVAFGTDLAAGDPGPAAELPASTGRSAAEGIPDSVIEPDSEPVFGPDHESDPDPGPGAAV